MNVIVCGPESSGTRILHAIVRDYIGVDAIHRSLPYAGEWWNWHDLPDARFVVIQRRPDVTTQSILARHMAADAAQHRADWQRAIAMLATIANAYWLSYEALTAAPRVQADNIAAWLGVTPSGAMPEIVDNNAKWLAT